MHSLNFPTLRVAGICFLLGLLFLPSSVGAAAVQAAPPQTVPLRNVLQEQHGWKRWNHRWLRRAKRWDIKRSGKRRLSRRGLKRYRRWKKRYDRRRWKRLPRRYRYNRYNLCRRLYKQLQLSARVAKQQCKRKNREQLSHIISIALKVADFWQEHLGAASSRFIRKLKRRRQRRLSVSRWYWDRYRRDKMFQSLNHVDLWVQPSMFRWPKSSWHQLLKRFSKLLGHPALRRRYEVAMLSRISRWQVQRLDPVSARSSIRGMWRFMLRQQECPWWYLVYITTLSPQTMNKLGPHLSPDWCKARRTGMSMSHISNAQMEKKLKFWARKYRRIARLRKIGLSSQGRPIWGLQLGFRRKLKSKPKIVLVGGQHGDEHLGADLLMEMTGRLLRRYTKREREVRRWLLTRQIWVVPLLNPDARVFDLAGGVVKWWRYNRHVMANGEIGVDLNRNYSYKWKPWKYYWYRGTFLPGKKPFSEPETHALKRLFDRLRNVRAVLDVHQYGRVLLMPWAFTKKGIPQPYQSRFRYLSDRLRKYNRYRSFPARRLYPHQGTLGDWGFGAHKAWSLVLELGSRNYVSREYKKYIVRSNRHLLDEFIRLGASPFPFQQSNSGVPAN
jgi:hypothetical protein